MKIINKKVTVSLTKEEKKAFLVVADILKELRVEYGNSFIWAVVDDDGIFYDKSAVIEFSDNEEEEEEEE